MSKKCEHEWGIDGIHSNEYCKKCFITKPDDAMSKKEFEEKPLQEKWYGHLNKNNIKDWGMIELWAWIEEEIEQARSEALEDAVNCFPTTWLDNMLSGDRAVMGAPPFYCPDIERLLTKIKDNINQLKGD